MFAMVLVGLFTKVLIGVFIKTSVFTYYIVSIKQCINKKLIKSTHDQ